MASLKKCIAEKCKQCTYDPSNGGGWRLQVEQCTVRTCALWEVRPVTSESTVNRRKTDDMDAIIASLEDDNED